MKKLFISLFIFWLLFLFSLPIVYLRFHFLKELYVFGVRVRGLSTSFLALPFFTSFIFLAFSVLVFLKLVRQVASIEKRYKRILLIISLLNIITLIPVSYLLLLSSQYSNYLYSNFGFIKAHLNWFVFASGVTGILFLFLSCDKFPRFGFVIKLRYKLSCFRKGDLYDFMVTTLVLLLLFCLSFSTVFNIFPKLDNDTSYDKKFGRDFHYIDLLAKFVPDYGRVICPPPIYSFWPSIGNRVVVRYFLFPRELIAGGYFGSDAQLIDCSVGDYFFVFVPSFGNIPEWPIINYSEKQISFDNGDNFINYVKLEEVENSSGVFRICFN